MRQYQPARANDWWPEDRPMLEGKTVFERDASWQDSGLLDANGRKLMVRDGIGPIGFVTFGGR